MGNEEESEGKMRLRGDGRVREMMLRGERRVRGER